VEIGMPGREIERVQRDRRLTPEEAVAERELRAKIEADLPSLREQAKAAKLGKRAKSVWQTIEALKDERERQGLSLKDIESRTGVVESELSRLEEDVDKDPTINALLQYADALGKSIEIKLTDQAVPHE